MTAAALFVTLSSQWPHTFISHQPATAFLWPPQEGWVTISTTSYESIIISKLKVRRKKKRAVEPHRVGIHHSESICLKVRDSIHSTAPHQGQSNLHLIYSPFLIHLLQMRKWKPKALSSRRPPRYSGHETWVFQTTFPSSRFNTCARIDHVLLRHHI